jgi:uncharacterized cupredoxin-like copper-binding protein
MYRLLVLAALLPAIISVVSPTLAQEATPPAASCHAPPLPPGTPIPQQTQATPAPEDASLAPTADEATAARIIAGIENFVACRNAGNYAAYAALVTPNRLLVEAGTTNPYDLVADLQAFNLPITTLSLGDVRSHPDGRFSAEFVHLFGPHLYYRSRLFVLEEGGYVKFDEERYLPEEPPGEQSAVDVRLIDFAFELSQDAIANAQYVVLRGQNSGAYPHEIVVARLPEGATVEQALTGAVPEDQIEFIGQTAIAPGQSDDLVLVNLVPGTYTLLCLLDEPDGVPHAARGMAAQLTIEGTAASTP